MNQGAQQPHNPYTVVRI